MLGLKDTDQLSEYHRGSVKQALKNGSRQRGSKWTESIAVGNKKVAVETKAKLDIKAIGRKELENNVGYEFRESQITYNPFLSRKNAL